MSATFLRQIEGILQDAIHTNAAHYCFLNHNLAVRSWEHFATDG